jgi:hypothetical protein
MFAAMPVILHNELLGRLEVHFQVALYPGVHAKLQKTIPMQHEIHTHPVQTVARHG